ncbi:hypothetical protein JCGZ_03185 [Jatropha curcas]|uniref:Uncharacterized protein n=1 Tax=Jatropha curcas TaxID=180498 RepID=A0A067JDQ1_JATCU|nr:hypothetical protein JCGZ_03185 [Jatropha curcas]
MAQAITHVAHAISPVEHTIGLQSTKRHSKWRTPQWPATCLKSPKRPIRKHKENVSEYLWCAPIEVIGQIVPQIDYSNASRMNSYNFIPWLTG